jgi:hypothetical protein
MLFPPAESRIKKILNNFWSISSSRATHVKRNPQMWNKEGPNNRVAHIVACRANRCATTVKREDIIGKFLGNGSVNTSPLLGSIFLITERVDYNHGRAVFSAWSVARG